MLTVLYLYNSRSQRRVRPRDKNVSVAALLIFFYLRFDVGAVLFFLELLPLAK